MVVERFGVYPVPLDPGVGAEMRKTRPCVVVSPNAMNRLVRTVLVAPLTTKRRTLPYRVDCEFEGQKGQVALDHLRPLDKTRLLRRLGKLDSATAGRLAETLVEMFR